jgi:hypothetical protein
MENQTNGGSGSPALPCSESSAEDVDPYQSEDYQRFMGEVAKTCDADDSPCDSCLAGAPCDGPSRLDPLWDSGLDDDDLYDSQNDRTLATQPAKEDSDSK